MKLVKRGRYAEKAISFQERKVFQAEGNPYQKVRVESWWNKAVR